MASCTAVSIKAFAPLPTRAVARRAAVSAPRASFMGSKVSMKTPMCTMNMPAGPKARVSFKQSRVAALGRAAQVARAPRAAVTCMAAGEKVRLAILGASGYTGAECCRLVAGHPNLEIVAVTGESKAGMEMSAVFPHLDSTNIPTICKTDDVDFSQVDAAFCCLPHATTQEIIASLPTNVKVVDLSADFRLRDVKQYAEWYGGEHRAPDLQKEAVYGLTEIYREDIRGARIVANPGCYPTSIQLPLIPLLKAGLILTEDIIIDSKSGVTGAGRGAKEAFLYCEVNDGMMAYGLTKHRHLPEIEQGLSEFAGEAVKVSFTPHLIPMSRGMESTIYIKGAPGTTADSIRKTIADAYATDRFVKVLPAGGIPHTRHVKGSNHCFIGVFEDALPGRFIISSVIDNLVKGAAGQAMQNMNIVCGFPEEMGLLQEPMFP